MTNPVSGGFQFTPPTGLNDVAAYPTTPVSEAAARQQVMDMYWQLMNEMNLPTLSASAYGQYNKFINGNFDRWERGTSFTNPVNGSYVADRWKTTNFSDGGVPPTTITQSKLQLNSGDISGASWGYRTSVNGAGSGFGPGSYYRIQQFIENGTRYLCGLGKKITVSFWAKSDIPGKRIGVDFNQNYGTGGSPSGVEVVTGATVTLSTNWTKYTVTFISNTLTGKSFGTNSDDFVAINFYYQWGTTYQGRVNAPSVESFVGAGNIDIAQVQVNAGDQALPFQPKAVMYEEIDSQRYNIRLTSTDTYTVYGVGQAISATQARIFIPFPRKMRVFPTLTYSGVFGLSDAAGNLLSVTGVTIDTNARRQDGINLNVTVASGLVAGNATCFQANANANAYLNFDAEL